MADARSRANRLVLGETRAVFEPARLALNSLRLATQPRGDGRTVFVLPGLAASDSSTAPLRAYLRGLGYNARGWGLGQNDGNVRQFVRDMTAKVERAVDRDGAKVPLVGWSLGGVISREVALRRPELVEQVITLGSPVVSNRTVQVPLTVIYTRDDGVVPWDACIDRANGHAEHVEVRSTHFGLGFHHAVFVEVARRLHTKGKRHIRATVSRP
jgi:alpha-beta hydrolase superfamily lysophospholipase